MKLSEFVGKKIKITLVDKEIFEGKCLEYTKAIENDPEIDSIDVKIDGKVYEIYENEIKNIEVI